MVLKCTKYIHTFQAIITVKKSNLSVICYVLHLARVAVQYHDVSHFVGRMSWQLSHVSYVLINVPVGEQSLSFATKDHC